MRARVTNRRVIKAAAAVMLAGAVGAITTTAGGAYAQEKPAASVPVYNTVRGQADPPAADKQVIISAGHVDFGPYFAGSKLRTQLRDDTGQTPVWRPLTNVVLEVKDNAKTVLPADSAYAFIDAKPGSDIWVLPQTQQADIIWPGWNTQDPQIIEKVAVGTTMTLKNVTGPGSVAVYLQEGNFGTPKPVFLAPNPEKQAVWVENNTHVHANWVFTKPGIYGLEFEFSAELKDGSKVSDSAVLRFAVGDNTRAEDAFSLQPVRQAATASSSNTAAVSPTAFIITAATLLLLALAAWAFTQQRAKTRALQSFEDEKNQDA